MVRGISKQVVVINGNHRDFFEQAFFVLKDGHLKEGISEKDLLRQAKIALGNAGDKAKRISIWRKAMWVAGGFLLCSGIWLLVYLL
jgi:hypothetical protein